MPSGKETGFLNVILDRHMTGLHTNHTPNPDSLKFTMDGGSFIESGMVVVGSVAEAADHPLASRLFAVEGVANILILPEFLTVTKRSTRDWDTLLPILSGLIEDYFSR